MSSSNEKKDTSVFSQMSPSSHSSNEEEEYHSDTASERGHLAKTPMIHSSSSSFVQKLIELDRAASGAAETMRQYADVDPPPDSEEGDPKHASNPWSNLASMGERLGASRYQLEQAWDNLKLAREKNAADWELDSEESDEEEEKDEGDLRVRIDPTKKVDLDTIVDLSIGDNNFQDAENESDDKKEEAKLEDYDSRKDDFLSDEEFRSHYINMMTETFGDALEELHQQAEDTGFGEDSGAKPTKNHAPIDVDVIVECLESGMDLLEPHEKNSKQFFASLGYDGTGDTSMSLGIDKQPDNEDEITIHEMRQRELGWVSPPTEEGGDETPGSV